MPIELPAGDERYLWRCDSCDRKFTGSEVTKEFDAPAVHRNRRRFAVCPLCGGISYHLEEERGFKEQAARETSAKTKRLKYATAWMSLAGLIFLALPACAGFLMLVVSSIAIGPLAFLSIRMKMATLVLAGACTFFLTFMGVGFLIPESWPAGYVVFIPCYLGVLLLSLLLSYVTGKIGDGVGGIIFRS